MLYIQFQYFRLKLMQCRIFFSKIVFTRRSYLHIVCTSTLDYSFLIWFTLSEQRAIAYCKQRCVGVPQDLISMSCDAQLGAKISKLKPYFRFVILQNCVFYFTCLSLLFTLFVLFFAGKKMIARWGRFWFAWGKGFMPLLGRRFWSWSCQWKIVIC